jgi:hypothetical protein
VKTRRVRVAVATLGAAAVAAAACVLVVATRGTEHADAAAASGGAAPTASCAERLVADWSDGRIDRTYSIGCYRAALKSLPTDLEVYSSAPDDIRQALSARIVQGAGKKRATRTLAER